MITRFKFPPDPKQVKELKRKLHSALRVALTGKPDGPPVELIMEILGREETLMRLDRAILDCREA